jgi:signal transduction histidine kinase
MAWATSADPRDYFGPARAARSHGLEPLKPAGKFAALIARRIGIFAVAGAHLAMLGDLALAPLANGPDPQLGAAAPAVLPSLPWLTITGLTLAVLWLIGSLPAPRHLPAGAAAVPTPEAAAPVKAELLHAARAVSPRNADPMTGLLARVSHDLRTPLNAVMGFSDLMQREAFGPLGDARYQSYARHIHDSSAELLKAAEDTLAMTSLVAGPQAAASEAAPLFDLLTDAFAMALLGLPADARDPAGRLLGPVQLELAVSPALKVKCERRALRQAMINLISAGIARSVTRTLRITADQIGDAVCLQITTPVNTAAGRQGWTTAEDLPVCLARALLELQGMALTMAANGPAEWSAQVSLDGVAQRDFFAN